MQVEPKWNLSAPSGMSVWRCRPISIYLTPGLVRWPRGVPLRGLNLAAARSAGRRFADLFRRYTAEFRRMAHGAELEQATKAFRKEVDTLTAEHGRDAVVQAALLLVPIGPPTLN